MIKLKMVGAVCSDLPGALCSGQVGAVSSGQVGAIYARFPVGFSLFILIFLNLH